jgi:hypothetical protein
LLSVPVSSRQSATGCSFRRWGAEFDARFDEALLILIAPVFVIFYRGPMRSAWATALDP